MCLLPWAFCASVAMAICFGHFTCYKHTCQGWHSTFFDYQLRPSPHVSYTLLVWSSLSTQATVYIIIIVLKIGIASVQVAPLAAIVYP